MSTLFGSTKRLLYNYGLPLLPRIHGQFLSGYFSWLFRKGFRTNEYTSAIQAFLKELDKDPRNKEEIFSLFSTAFEQAKKFDEWATQEPEYKVEDFNDFVQKLNKIVGGPPKFYRVNLDKSTVLGDVYGIPVFLIFNLISNTPAGYKLLCRDDVNAALHALLTEWGKYLTTEASSAALTDKEGGWFSDPAKTLLELYLEDLGFDDTYVTELEKPQRYKTWDSFFTRVFKHGRPDGKPVRPIIPQRDDKPFFVYNPCESTVLCYASNVQNCDRFWIKGQNYSLYDMLGSDKHPELSKYAKDLKGGSILLSYLSPQDYHRWHSPVTGTVLAAQVLPGTLYADEKALDRDIDHLPGDSQGPVVRLQPWLNLSSTRGALVIKPTEVNAHIDLIAFIAIGMAEVSSCEITCDRRSTPHPEQVEAGTELGMFHYGGSAYALVVKPEKGYKVMFQDSHDTPLSANQHYWVHSVVAQVCPEDR